MELSPEGYVINCDGVSVVVVTKWLMIWPAYTIVAGWCQVVVTQEL